MSVVFVLWRRTLVKCEGWGHVACHLIATEVSVLHNSKMALKLHISIVASRISKHVSKLKWRVEHTGHDQSDQILRLENSQLLA